LKSLSKKESRQNQGLKFWAVFLSLLALKSNQNAFDLLIGDFYFGDVEAAKIKPLPV
jgi:hypothetical protein